MEINSEAVVVATVDIDVFGVIVVIQSDATLTIYEYRYEPIGYELSKNNFNPKSIDFYSFFRSVSVCSATKLTPSIRTSWQRFHQNTYNTFIHALTPNIRFHIYGLYIRCICFDSRCRVGASSRILYP